MTVAVGKRTFADVVSSGHVKDAIQDSPRALNSLTGILIKLGKDRDTEANEERGPGQRCAREPSSCLAQASRLGESRSGFLQSPQEVSIARTLISDLGS